MATLADLRDGLCVGMDPELFFDGRRAREARDICSMCNLRETCLSVAVGLEEFDAEQAMIADGQGTGGGRGRRWSWGVWGGVPAETRKLLTTESLPTSALARSHARSAA